MTYIDVLNRRLGEGLGFVCGGTKPRFAWVYAPDQPRWVYDRDDRTLLKKSWASLTAPDGEEVGRSWMLAQWKHTEAIDHHGFASGIRVPVIHEWAYQPHLETVLARGQEPTIELTLNYIFALSAQLQRSAEHDVNSFSNYMAEEKYTADKNQARDKEDWRETAAASYDEHVGAYGNCTPGARGGYLSFQNNESQTSQTQGI